MTNNQWSSDRSGKKNVALGETFRSSKMTDRVLLQLVQDIVAGRLPEAQPAPTEAELVARFEISKVAAREVVRVLSALNLVDVQQGKRSSVQHRQDWNLFASVVQQALRIEWGPKKLLDQLFEARLIIEPAATAMAADRSTPEGIYQLEMLVTEMSAIVSTSGDVRALLAADRGFHDGVASMVGNDMLRAMVRDLHILMVDNWEDSKVEAVDLPSIVDQHQAIFEALREGAPDRARIAMIEHIRTAREMEVGRR